MAIYVDGLSTFFAVDRGDALSKQAVRVGNRHGNQWCHLFTDGSLDDLHLFARRLGMKREWFQNHTRLPHYDLVPSKRAKALALGAIEVDRRRTVEIMKDWETRNKYAKAI